MLKNTPKIKEKYLVKNALVSYYLLLMFWIFPLYFTNQYSNIRHDKLNFFLILSSLFIFVQSVILLCSHFGNKNELQDEKWYKSLSITDYAFAAFILCAVLSTTFSQYPLESFTGTQGRNNGLLLLLIYFGIYIVISRLFMLKEYVFIVFAVTSLAVYVLCIVNHFYIDPLGMFQNYSQKVAMDFTSTLGNKNLMSSYCTLTIPLFLMLFINRTAKYRFLYLATSAIGFSSILCADSESGFLGLVPLIIILTIYYIKSPKRLSQLFFAGALMLICGKLLQPLELIIGESKGFGSIQSLIIHSLWSYVFTIIALILASLMYYFRDKTFPGILQKSAIGISIAAVCTVIFAFVFYTFADTKTPLSSPLSYLRFNGGWGTHRGYMWIKSFEIFIASGFKNMLLGCGPDTFYSAFAPYFQELNTLYGNTSTNCAHNEFINYLITLGVAGLGAYLILMASIIVRAFKSAKSNPMAIVFISGAIGYLLQSTVNIAQPITTPLFIILIALTENANRKYC